MTTYSYDPSTGLLINTDYSDTTPDISFTYNRLGLRKTITDAQGTRNFAYNDNLQNYEETLSGNLNTTITRTFETATAGALGRSTGISHDLGYTVSYGCDAASGRFNTVNWQVGSATDSATYSFMTNSHLIQDLVYDSGTKALYGFEPQRDIRNQVKNQFSSALISQYDYTHDPLGRVESMTTPDDIFASYLPVGQGNAVDFSKSSDVAYTADSVNQYTEITRNSVPTSLNYDDDGNLLDDATLTYTWNAENRLIGVEPVALTGDSDKKLEFTYDYMGRRVEKKIFTATMGEYNLSSTTKYLYDGWNLIAELDEDGTTQAAYVWGLDLSQSLRGAGGVGGLLARVDSTTNKTLLYLYDGNGNVERLVDSTDGSLAAVYKYGPYGNLISQAGLYAEVNPFRFSTKYFDIESSLYYYGYRYYAPELGRWGNRDPIGEEGGLNLYSCVQNDPVNFADPMGLFTYYKRWGGPDWTAGRKGSWDTLPRSIRVDIERQIRDGWDPNSPFAPRDEQDACYMIHDICYGECRERCQDDPCPEGCMRKGLNDCDDGLNRCLMGIGLTGNPLDEARRLAAIPVFFLQPANRNARAINRKKGTPWWFRWEF